MTAHDLPNAEARYPIPGAEGAVERTRQQLTLHLLAGDEKLAFESVIEQGEALLSGAAQALSAWYAALKLPEPADKKVDDQGLQQGWLEHLDQTRAKWAQHGLVPCWPALKGSGDIAKETEELRKSLKANKQSARQYNPWPLLELLSQRPSVNPERATANKGQRPAYMSELSLAIQVITKELSLSFPAAYEYELRSSESYGDAHVNLSALRQWKESWTTEKWLSQPWGLVRLESLLEQQLISANTFMVVSAPSYSQYDQKIILPGMLALPPKLRGLQPEKWGKSVRSRLESIGHPLSTQFSFNIEEEQVLTRDHQQLIDFLRAKVAHQEKVSLSLSSGMTELIEEAAYWIAHELEQHGRSDMVDDMAFYGGGVVGKKEASTPLRRYVHRRLKKVMYTDGAQWKSQLTRLADDYRAAHECAQRACDVIDAEKKPASKDLLKTAVGAEAVLRLLGTNAELQTKMVESSDPLLERVLKLQTLGFGQLCRNWGGGARGNSGSDISAELSRLEALNQTRRTAPGHGPLTAAELVAQRPAEARWLMERNLAMIGRQKLQPEGDHRPRLHQTLRDLSWPALPEELFRSDVFGRSPDVTDLLAEAVRQAEEQQNEAVKTGEGQ